MRGRGSPGIKSWISSAFALGGAAALIWGLQSADPTLQSTVAAKTMGTIVLVIALLMTANYLYTLSLIGCGGVASSALTPVFSKRLKCCVDRLRSQPLSVSHPQARYRQTSTRTALDQSVC